MQCFVAHVSRDLVVSGELLRSSWGALFLEGGPLDGHGGHHIGLVEVREAAS